MARYVCTGGGRPSYISPPMPYARPFITLLSAALLACVAVGAVAQPTTGQPSVLRPLVVTHVTVVDPVDGVTPDVTVVIRDRQIVRIAQGASVANPPGAQVVNGRGKFLIPGLWDAHVHLSWTTRSALPVLVANGVTSVRDMGSKLSEIDDWRARISASVLVGPRIFRSGPILNGQRFNAYQLVVGTPDETRGVVRALKEAGVDFLKVHRRVPKESLLALLDEAKKVGLPVVGHIPMTVSPGEAASLGFAGIEHTETLFEGTFAASVGDGPMSAAVRRYREQGLPELMARFVSNRVPVTPTLVAYRSLLDLARPTALQDPRMKYVALSQRRELEKMPRPSATDLEEVGAMFAELRSVVAAMHAAGVELLVGTDAAGPRIPGFTVQEELALLVEAGLSPMQALTAATLRPAQLLGQASLGRVAIGQAADVVLLDGNPLENIRNTTRIRGVVLNGRWLDRPALDALLKEGEALASQM